MAIRVEHGPDLNLVGDVSFGAGMQRGQYQSAQDLADLYRQLQGLQLQRGQQDIQQSQFQQQFGLQEQQNQRQQQDQFVQLLSAALPAVGFGLAGPAGGLLANQVLGNSQFSVPQQPEQMVPVHNFGQLTNPGQFGTYGQQQTVRGQSPNQGQQTGNNSFQGILSLLGF